MTNPTQFLFPPYPFELRTVPIWMLACIWATGLTVEVRAQDHAGDKQALVALYNATDGANWTNNENWLSEQPLSTWHGVIVSDGRVTRLSLHSNRLTGSIPAELGNLTSLRELSLSSNRLTGSIPAQLGNLASLTHLYLWGNQLTGPIPAQLGDLSSLTHLYLSRNQLTGSIPAQLGNLASLTHLYLSDNQLTGSIPAQLGNLASLTRLSLSRNQLTDPIPAQLGNLASLTHLYLYGNQLTGPIPAQLGDLSSLGALYLHRNQLTGSIPPELGNLSSLRTLSLSNNSNLSGTLPGSFTGLEGLAELYLDGTGLCVPTDAAFQMWLTDIGQKGGVTNCGSTPGGGSLMRLTRDGADNLSPAWSPDGARIAYWSFSEDFEGFGSELALEVMHADGMEPSRLTQVDLDSELGELKFYLQPAWSPDGTKIAFWSNDDIYIVGANGSNLTRLTNSDRFEVAPAWSPDGTKIAFTSLPVSEDRFESEIYVVNADGSNLARLADSDRFDAGPAWSPDGTKIAFTSLRLSEDRFESEIYVVNADGSNLARLTNSDRFDAGPAWSPDGTKIAFWSSRDGGTDLDNINLAINVMDADGSNPTRLTRMGADPLPVQGDDVFEISLVAWSPDGARIAFQAPDPDVNSYDTEIYVVDAGSGDLTRLTQNSALDWLPSWSPDGTKITFASDSAGNFEIYVVGIEGDGSMGSIEGDRDALVALYNATDGANWKDNTNWLSDRPLGEWHGVTVQDGRVTALDLSDNQLTGTLPTELGNLSSLTKLDLSDNQLTGTLPDSFARLRALASFRFDGNSGLCADAAIQTWLGGIDDVRGPHCSLSESTSDLFIPVILTASGQNNSFFTSELTLTNRGSEAATLHHTYTAAAGGGSGEASETLAPGRQRIVLHAIDHLRTLGIPIPNAGSRYGTLRVALSGSSDVGVSVRTATRVADGRAGLAYPGVATGFEEAVYLCGLRQDSQDRSNLAFQNMGAPGQGNITVRTTVYSGEADDTESRLLGEVELEPGGFHQYNRVLKNLGSPAQGYVKVEKVEGTAPFYAYGVINDQANSDGSFVFPVTAGSLEGAMGQTLPVIVETGVFSTELMVTNFSQEAKTLLFSFVADGLTTPDRTARFRLEIGAGRQRIIPDVIDAELRRKGVGGVRASRGATLAGALFATVASGDMSGIVIGARTGSSDGRGGQYGVFYNAVPYGGAFLESAWVEALQQNEENRSNLALVNTGEVDNSPSVFQLDIYDGATGMLANTVTGLRVAPRGWRQINGILGRYAPGTSQGYVRISKVSGNNPFLAYGVINDGGAPGQRSGDGAYLPARE